MGNSTQRISKKVTNQVKFIPSSSHPHLNSSLIFFLSHLIVYALSPVFLSFSFFFLSRNATASFCLSIYFHLLYSHIHKPNSSYSHLFTFCFPSNTAFAFFFFFTLLLSRPKSMEHEFRYMTNLLILHDSLNTINPK